jgi:hypothetical protein
MAREEAGLLLAAAGLFPGRPHTLPSSTQPQKAVIPADAGIHADYPK